MTSGSTDEPVAMTFLNRRNMLRLAGGLATAASASKLTEGATAAAATPTDPLAGHGQGRAPNRPLNQRQIGYMLPHEQFRVPDLVGLGQAAERAGFSLLATSDHFQPWQANEGHSGAAWVTMAALGGHTERSWMGTTVTCPTLRYNPAVVAEAFASLSLLYPGRIFLGVGSGEALNEQAATGMWPRWRERWDRLIEAIGIICDLWKGQPVHHKGKHYTVDARLYDPPAAPIPILTAANGNKAMKLAGQYGDGLVTDPKTWKSFKSEWEAGARAAGKDPAKMPVLIEQYVVVGDDATARQAAELWRFGPKAFKGYENIPNPAEIQRRAETELSLEKVMDGWAIGTDPARHIATIKELFDSGATIVNIHTGQADQRKLIDFYGAEILPKFL